jgi:hypothetical protein
MVAGPMMWGLFIGTVVNFFACLAVPDPPAAQPHVR